MKRITHLMIAGSRYSTYEALNYARRVVQRAHQLGYTIVVGDNPNGVDMAVVQECRRLKAKVLVVGITNFPRNNGCSHGSYVKVEWDTYRAASGYLLDHYHTRDRWMVGQRDSRHFHLERQQPRHEDGLRLYVKPPQRSTSHHP